MLFKYPSLLYALFALLIPIFIHLFKLRKFKKTAFTNVAFLEKIKLQTRKSSQLKKWLVLLSRLSIFTGLILAFAQPYLPSKNNKEAPNNYIIYLDNSFSMQAKGTNGPLLKRAIQEFIEQFDINQNFTLFTNTEVYKNISISEVQNELMNIDYVSEQLTPKQVELKFKQLEKKSSNTALIAISDFQKHLENNYNNLKKLNVAIIKLTPQEFKNVAIDSLWLQSKDNELLLKITSTSNEFSEKLPLSIFNGTNLIGKAELDFSLTNKQEVSIPLPKNKSINGVVQINSPGLTYDNKRYFSINKPSKTKILVIGDNTDYLKKIFTVDEFQYTDTTLSNLNYATISNVDCIVLNEISDYSNALIQNITEFTTKGGVLSIIPPKTENSEFINFLKKSYNLQVGSYNKTEKKLTQISFQHPIFKNVFSKTINNFQYPSIKEGYQIKNGEKILGLEDNTLFLVQKNNVFLFATAISQHSNFKQSPLIVPCFYNIGKFNSTTSRISYNIDQINEINIATINQNKDEVLAIKGEKEEFIPLQQVFKNFVKISTTNLPKNAGNYTINNKNKVLSFISYNYPTYESNLIYNQFLESDTNSVTTSVAEYFINSKADYKIKELWKWFLIFALAFLVIEILLLKFLK